MPFGLQHPLPKKARYHGAFCYVLLLFLIITILEICKRPTYQNILTVQGAYTSKNSDNMLQHKTKFNKIHIHLLYSARAHTHTHTHTYTYTRARGRTHAGRHAYSTHASIQAGQQKMGLKWWGGGGGRGSGGALRLTAETKEV